MSSSGAFPSLREEPPRLYVLPCAALRRAVHLLGETARAPGRTPGVCGTFQARRRSGRVHKASAQRSRRRGLRQPLNDLLYLDIVAEDSTVFIGEKGFP